MATFHFVGNYAEVPGLPLLTDFGQAVELTHAQYVDLLHARLALLTAAEFASLGVTSDELKAGASTYFGVIPGSVQGKKNAAHEIFRKNHYHVDATGVLPAGHEYAPAQTPNTPTVGGHAAEE